MISLLKGENNNLVGRKMIDSPTNAKRIVIWSGRDEEKARLM